MSRRMTSADAQAWMAGWRCVIVDGSDLDRLRHPLAAMMRWYGADGIRAAVIGGVAASLLGKPRLTKDIDAVVLDASAEALIESWAAFGFFLRVGRSGFGDERIDQRSRSSSF